MTDKSLKKEEFDSTFHSTILQYAKYSRYVYKDKYAIPEANILLNNLKDIHNQSAVKNIPKHLVFYDHLLKVIVVALRGTASSYDMITNAQFDTIPFCMTHSVSTSTASTTYFYSNEDVPSIIRAHRGMTEAAHVLHNIIQPVINDARNRHHGRYRHYPVVVTGHSMGAGVGSLLAILLNETQQRFQHDCNYSNCHNESSKDKKSHGSSHPPPTTATSSSQTSSQPSLVPVTAYLFACPPVVSHAHIESTCKIYNFVNKYDIISRLSFNEFNKFLSALKVIDVLPFDAKTRRNILINGTLSAEQLSLIDNGLQTVHGNMSRTSPPTCAVSDGDVRHGTSTPVQGNTGSNGNNGNTRNGVQMNRHDASKENISFQQKRNETSNSLMCYEQELLVPGDVILIYSSHDGEEEKGTRTWTGAGSGGVGHKTEPSERNDQSKNDMKSLILKSQDVFQKSVPGNHNVPASSAQEASNVKSISQSLVYLGLNVNSNINNTITSVAKWMIKDTREGQGQGQGPGAEQEYSASREFLELNEKETKLAAANTVKHRMKRISNQKQLYTGHLLTGDTMFYDHLISQYITSILHLESPDQ